MLLGAIKSQWVTETLAFTIFFASFQLFSGGSAHISVIVHGIISPFVLVVGTNLGSDMIIEPSGAQLSGYDENEGSPYTQRRDA
jgi:hypothetical protein